MAVDESYHKHFCLCFKTHRIFCDTRNFTFINLIFQFLFQSVIFLSVIGCADNYIYQENIGQTTINTSVIDSLRNWESYFKRDFDKINNFEIKYLIPSDNILIIEKNISDLTDNFWGTFMIVKDRNGKTDYFFVVNHEGHDLLYFYKNKTELKVIADTVKFHFDCHKTNHDEEVFIYQCFQKYAFSIEQETAYFRISKKEIKEIVYADRLQMQIIGKNEALNTIVPDDAKIFWREFYRREIKYDRD